MGAKYIKGFDGLRAISILFVLQAHLGGYLFLQENTFINDRHWHLISGDMGVTIFFVISGFLITKILLNEQESTSKINLRNFYIRRLLRLAPALLLLLATLFVLMSLMLIKQSYLGLFMALTYTFNFAPLHDMTPELGHIWSLSVEEQYYFLWPIAIVVLNNYKKLLFLSGILIFICILLLQFMGRLPFIDNSTVHIMNYDIIIGNFFKIRHWFLPSIAPILIGSSFAILTHAYSLKTQAYLSNTTLVLMASFLLYLSPLFLPLLLVPSFHIIQSLGVGIFLTWLFYRQDSICCQLLEYKPIKYIGRISYGLYVYHGLFVRTGPEGATLSVQDFPINLFLTVIVAILSYELMEKKFLTLKNKYR